MILPIVSSNEETETRKVTQPRSFEAVWAKEEKEGEEKEEVKKGEKVEGNKEGTKMRPMKVKYRFSKLCYH